MLLTNLHSNFSNPIPIVERYYNLTPGSIYGETDFYNYDPAVLGNDSAYPVGRKFIRFCCAKIAPNPLLAQDIPDLVFTTSNGDGAHSVSMHCNSGLR